jgi:hypothetical protein
MPRTALICSKADIDAPKFLDALQCLTIVYEKYIGIPREDIKTFVSPNIFLPDITNNAATNVFVVTGLMANGIDAPQRISWKADNFSQNGYEIVVFDIQY